MCEGTGVARRTGCRADVPRNLPTTSDGRRRKVTTCSKWLYYISPSFPFSVLQGPAAGSGQKGGRHVPLICCGHMHVLPARPTITKNTQKGDREGQQGILLRHRRLRLFCVSGVVSGAVSGAHCRSFSNANPFPSTLERPTRSSSADILVHSYIRSASRFASAVINVFCRTSRKVHYVVVVASSKEWKAGYRLGTGHMSSTQQARRGDR